MLADVLSNKGEGIAARLDEVAYAPGFSFNRFPLAAADTGVAFTTDTSDISVTLLHGRLRFWSGGVGCLTYGRRSHP